MRYFDWAATILNDGASSQAEDAIAREHAVQTESRDSTEWTRTRPTPRTRRSSRLAVGVLVFGGAITVGWLALLTFGAAKVLLQMLGHI
jgi:anti-sigma factor RsiW